MCELPVEELYDLQNDSFEMRNLAADPAASATLNQMRQALKRPLEETGRSGGYRRLSVRIAMNRQARDRQPPVLPEPVSGVAAWEHFAGGMLGRSRTLIHD